MLVFLLSSLRVSDLKVTLFPAKMAKIRAPFSSSMATYSASSYSRSKNWSRVSSSSSSVSFTSSSFYILLLLVITTFAFLFFFFASHEIEIDDEDRKVPTLTLETPEVVRENLWDSPGFGYHPCTNPTRKYKAPEVSDRYISVRSNGGLNQMRTGISDMVVIAHIMNATLVIPELDKRSFWQDSSVFSDVFDEQYFIKALEGDVRIVKELPKQLASVPRARKHFSSWASMGYYQEMANLFKEYQVVHVPKSDSRLANNDLPIDIQRLRCRALYHALRFSAPIENLGKKRYLLGNNVNLGSESTWPITPQKLVERLKSRGRYIALHLRYEKDMLSFTGCTYGLSDAEAEELKIMRQNTKHWKMKDINSTDQRIEGHCPLTPKEVGLFLRSLGFPASTWIYVAAGTIYGGEARLADLRAYFPNLIFKETLATPEELRVISNHSSQNAALDYIISVESDVFVPSYTGNMARAVEGHRRFLGHRKTYNPDRKGLVEVFERIAQGELKGGPSLSSIIIQMHASRQGAPRRRYGPLPGTKGRGRSRTEESFYENPFPECICKSHKHVN